MGRWAQHRRRGSSRLPPAAAPSLITITSVTVFNSLLGQISVGFSDVVTAADFDPTAFTDVDVGAAGITVVQQGATGLLYANLIDFASATSGDAWSFTDTVAGVATPQAGLIS